jgi:mono/diheme cytochrome c family protein
MSPEDFTPQATRENPDPEEAGEPIPKWLLAVAVTLTLGCSYFILRTSGTSATENGDTRTVGDLRHQAQVAPGAVAVIDGAAIFAARCAACHQASGTGLPGVFPPLAGSNWVNGRDTTVIQIVLRGIQGSLTVNGVAYHGTMPTFAPQLTDAEIAAVVTHVRGHWGNHAGAVAATLVTTQRATIAEHSAPWLGDADLPQAP